MDRWNHLDSAAVPGGGEMQLWQRGTEFVIRVDGADLMSTRMHGSEDALADTACDSLENSRPGLDGVRILIGGLGLGFTAAAALKRVGPNAEVTVAELVPEVVDWNRGPLGAVAEYPVTDPRTDIYIGDVADLIRSPKAPWDAILLDVDNGPDGLTQRENDRLYNAEGLSLLRQALLPGGTAGIWSAAPDERFSRRIKEAGFRSTEELRVRARGKKGAVHTIWRCIA